MKKNFLMFAACGLLMLTATAQNVAINTDGSKANANAILDIKSANKGILIPRMTTDARSRLGNTKGLLVYDINTDNFWYHNGKEWKCIPNDDDKGKNGNAWLITGNNNTKDNVNFLGTTNNVPLNFRVNNQPSGRIDSAKDVTFFGYKAGSSNTTGNDNTASGFQALLRNTEGGFNTAFGSKSLDSNTTGAGNTALGYGTLFFNTTGSENTALGIEALFFNRTGTENVAIGDGAMTRNNSGSFNVAAGFQPLLTNRTGSNNIAIGNSALYYNISGNANTAIGSSAMFFLDSAFNNTAVGSDCLPGNHTGNNNTGLGADANVAAGDLNNATAIGAGAIVDASNKVRIGNAAVTVIEGQVPFTTPSDGRYKFNVAEDVKGLDFILQLRPVTYQFDVKRFDGQLNRQSGNTGGNAGGSSGGSLNYAMQVAYDEATRIRRSGFIAQEVEQAAQSTGYDFSGIIRPRTEQDHYSLSYDAFVVPLVKAVQEQQVIIHSQSRQLDAQGQQISRLQKELDEIKALLSALPSSHN